MVISVKPYEITWNKLPDDFVLPDDPVDNINQPLLAAALVDSLNEAGLLSATTLTPTNYAICATVNNKTVVKAPDWAFIQGLRVPREEIIRSYTPQLQGEIPVIVMEFLSDTEGNEYSVKPTYPPGKWFFYEQILRVPNYAIFDPANGALEVYRLDESGRYRLQQPDANGRYAIAEMNLFLGVWQGSRGERTGPWLRWWSDRSELLLWAAERAEQESQRAEQERQRAEQERQRAERLLAQLRAAGIEPEEDG